MVRAQGQRRTTSEEGRDDLPKKLEDLIIRKSFERERPMHVARRSGDANLCELDVDAALAPVTGSYLVHGACGTKVEVTLQAPLLDRNHAAREAVLKNIMEASVDRIPRITTTSANVRIPRRSPERTPEVPRSTYGL